MASTKNKKGNSSISETNEQSVMQRHAAFFDRNHDGLIYPWETFQGLRAIGCGLAISTLGGVLLNMVLSGKTRPGKFPNLLFPIEIRNIQMAKHGSDTDAYDSQGRFVPKKFEEIFAKHAHANPNSLTSDELKEMLKANRDPKDFMGKLQALAEWKLLYKLCKDKDGLLHKDAIITVYDGSVFERLEKDKLSTLKKK